MYNAEPVVKTLPCVLLGGAVGALSTVVPKLIIKPICCVLNQGVLHLEQELLLTIAKESGRSEVRKLVRIVVNTGQCAQHKASELFQ